SAQGRSAALQRTAQDLFKSTSVEDLRTLLGMVATRRDLNRPMVFKSAKEMAIQSTAEFAPFFGCSLTDAILCSCAAVPFFAPAHVRVPGAGLPIEVIDGGFVANNPSFYAVA